MGRPRKSVLDKIASGNFRPSRDGDALIAELGVSTLDEAYAVAGYKPGGGRPSTPKHVKQRQHNYKPSRDRDKEEKLTPEEAEAAFIAEVGYTPRRQLIKALAGEPFDDPGVRSDMDWFASDFCEPNIMLFEGAQFRGKPMILGDHWRAFLQDALAFDDEGHRLFDTAIAEVPRKNAKSHTMAALGLALGSPSEGEGGPDIVLASGTAKQAKHLFGPAITFVRKSPLLKSIYMPLLTAITCPANDGSIYRIAADGDTQFGEGPYVNLCDELHIWTQPKQESLWTALRSAHGAREDYLDIGISTAGSDPETIFGNLHGYASGHPLVEIRGDMGSGGFILRDFQSKILYYCWAVAPEAELDDLAEWTLANPAYWRTAEHIEHDLADPLLDEGSKRRQYGNEWTSALHRWVSVDLWRHALMPGYGAKLAKANPSGEPDEFIPEGVDIQVGIDAAISHDTTAVAWAYKAADGTIHVRVRVWSVRPNVQHHVFVPGGRMDNEGGAEAFIRDVLKPNYKIRGVTYDPRYFETEATHLSRLGLIVADLSQNSGKMYDARQEFYRQVIEHRLRHDGDSVFAAHVGAANGEKTPSGWMVEAESEAIPIDGLTAATMAVFRAARVPDIKPWVLHSK